MTISQFNEAKPIVAEIERLQNHLKQLDHSFPQKIKMLVGVTELDWQYSKVSNDRFYQDYILFVRTRIVELTQKLETIKPAPEGQL